MMSDERVKALSQPIGAALPDWCGAAPPPRSPMAGHWCRLEPAEPARHAGELFEAYAEDREGRIWTYLNHGPFGDAAAFGDWLQRACVGNDPLVHAVIDAADGRAAGLASYLRIDPTNGVIEVGGINYAPRLQRTPAATEAMYLMMRRAFDELGYRRYEWKCDSLNAPSRRAAMRLGFCYEGLFRQAVVYKQRNRDTAWFSIIDAEWPALRAAFESWLAPDNFDAEGRQRQSLSALTAQARADAGLPPPGPA